MNEYITGEISHHPSTVRQVLTDADRLSLRLAPEHLAWGGGGAARLDVRESGMTIDSIIVDVEPPLMTEYPWRRSGEATRPLRWRVKQETSGAGPIGLPFRLSKAPREACRALLAEPMSPQSPSRSNDRAGGCIR